MTAPSLEQHRTMTLPDYIHELADPHRHTTPPQTTGVGWTRPHTITVPSLLDQLDAGVTAAPPGDQAEGHTGYASRPAVHVDSLDAAASIADAVHEWTRTLGARPTGDLHADLHRLNTRAHTLPRKTRARLEADVRRWWLRARIVTGWDTPPWSPDATCPGCGERGVLRIRFTESLALCTGDGCGKTWDQLSIGILAEHIRRESEHVSPRRRRGPCWCPVPEPVVVGIGSMCPACGSSRCVHVLDQST